MSELFLINLADVINEYSLYLNYEWVGENYYASLTIKIKKLKTGKYLPNCDGEGLPLDSTEFPSASAIIQKSTLAAQICLEQLQRVYIDYIANYPKDGLRPNITNELFNNLPQTSE